MFEHLYPEGDRPMMYSPLGSYVSFRQRIRERLIAGAVGVVLGLAAAGALLAAGVVP